MKNKKPCPLCGELMGRQSDSCYPCFVSKRRKKLFEGKNPNWRGGRTHTPGGYVLLRVPGHPRAKTRGKYVFEHILAMEKKLGRYLDVTEKVHHINGVPNDNRPENLELWSKGHPPGQRVDDLVEWVVGKYPQLVISSLKKAGAI